jgi:excisionase family DNA binding protein
MPPEAPTAPVPETTAESLLIGVEEAARLLGLSSKTVKRLIAAESLPGAVRIGRRRLVNRASLCEWVRLGCPRPSPKRKR